MLARHFTPGVVLATLITIVWGTNFFHYGVFDGAFSHAFSFFLLCAFADLSERWWDAPHAGRTLALGAIAGLILLARHTNAIFLLVLPLYGLTSTGQNDGASLAGGAGRGAPPTAGPSPVIASVGPRMGGAVRRQDPGREAWSALRHRTTALWQRRAAVLLMAGVAAAVFAPQLGVYRYATGRWLASPSAALGVGFDFSSPHLLGVLIGTRKGLLFWSPALLLAIGGFFVVHPFARRFLAATLVAFALDTYLIAS